MALILDGFLVLGGFFLGYFFQTLILIAFTIICVIIAFYMLSTFQEMEGLIAMAFTSCAIIANVTMWITHYMVTDQSSIQVFFKTYILR